jgi:Holliday junction resolvasome RuvABC endonuclease subunit
MIICGLDPSLNCLGWFIFDTDGMKIIDYGYIPNKDLEENEKVLRIYNMLSKVFDNYSIQGVGIEEEFSSKNVSTLKKLSHVHGAILLLLSQRNIPYTYYSVMTAKSKTLDGIETKKADGTKKTGDEMKEEVANKIFEVFGRKNFIKDFTNDVTDAASIGYTYYKMNGQGIEKKKKTKKKKDK